MKKILPILLFLVSFNVFGQSITVTSPNGSEEWQIGSSHNITWNSSNFIGNVWIGLWEADTIYIDQIVAQTANDGSFSWNVPLNLEPRNDYKIYIGGLNGPESDYSDNYFSLVDINVTAPNGGETLQTGNTTITWTDNISENVRIDLLKSDTLYYSITTSTLSDGSANWFVPAFFPTASDYKIKITSINDNNFFDISDNYFTILGKEINLTSPNGGESWEAGTQHSITWTDNITENVKIELYKSDILNSTISSSTSSDGSFNWTIPAALAPGSDYKVRISSVDDADVFGMSANNFTVSPPLLKVITPNGGESWQTGTTKTVTWTDNFSTNVKIELDNSGSLSTIIASTPNDGSYDWFIPYDASVGSSFKLKITSVENTSMSDLSDNNFSIVLGSISVTSPAAGDSLDAGNSYTITWTDNLTENVRIELYKGGSYYDLVTESTPSDGSYSGWTVNANTETGSDYQIKFTSIENSNIFDFSDNFFIQGPDIKVTSPNGGETWEVNTAHSILWNDNINENVSIELYKADTLYNIVNPSTSSDGSYNNWNIPVTFPTGSDYKMKIASVDNINVADFSDNYFTIQGPSLTVNSPNGGESWQIGSSQNITWTDNYSTNVKIELFKGGALNSTIVNSTSNNGTYTWAIPVGTATGSDYKIKISSLDYTDATDLSDVNFSITSADINVTNPNGGNSLTGGNTYSITWTDNLSENVKIDLFKGGNLYVNIISSTESDGLYDWLFPASLPTGADYKIKISSVTNSSIFDLSDNDFSISGREITITAPNGGESWEAGTQKTITWNDNIPGNVKIELFKAGLITSTISGSTESDGSFSWGIPPSTTQASDYTIKITSVDDADITDISNNNFTISPPVLTVTTPNGGESWQAGTLHSIYWTDNFSQNVKIELDNSGSFTTISASTPNVGGFDWSIPFDSPTGSTFKIKITSLENASMSDESDNTFSLTLGGITITSPNGGEEFAAGSTYPVTWTDNISENIKAELYKADTLFVTMNPSTASDGQYDWFFPASLPTGTNYKVKLSSVSNPGIFDFSDNYFTITGRGITITSPNGSEIWEAGTSHDITWTDNIIENVKIQLYKSGTFSSSISGSTSSDGVFNWSIPASTTPASDYSIKITSVNDANVTDLSDNNFTISSPLLTVTYPNGGENLQAGTLDTIRWTDNFSQNVKIELDNLGSLSTIISSTSNSGSYDWFIPYDTPIASSFKIKITSIENPSMSDESDNPFSVVLGSITVTSPNGGDSLQGGQAYNITWIDNLSENVRIELFKGGSFYSSVTISTPSDGLYAGWRVDANTETGSDYQIKITSVENNDIFDISDGTFFIQGPQVTMVSPNGGESWDTGTPYQIAWFDNINEDVSLELFKGDTLYFIINPQTPSDGTYNNWTIPSSTVTGSDYRIKIASVDNIKLFDFSDNYFTINGVSSVEMYSSNIPVNYSLSQNFPNPFNPTTKIEFGLKEESTVSLKIYNITGQEVSIVLNNDYLPAGTFRYLLDASNLTSGIYFYILRAASNISDQKFIQTKKMVLLK